MIVSYRLLDGRGGYVRFLTVSCCVCLLLLTMTTQPALATSGHGCAPLQPPPVAGPLVQPATTAGTLFINEVLTLTRFSWTCSPGPIYTNPAWVELYNAQDQALDLSAAHVSLDGGSGTNSFLVPIGSAIASHGFLVLFPMQNPWFAATVTSTIRLLIQGIPVDTVTIPTLALNQSYARVPDGGKQWQITAKPTIGSSNTGTLPLPAPSSKGSGSSNSSSNSNNGSVGTTGGVTATGTQPSWSKMSFPTATPAISAPVLVSTPVVQTNATPQGMTQMDVPRKLLLTVLVIALGLALLWGWRQFSSS